MGASRLLLVPINSSLYPDLAVWVKKIAQKSLIVDVENTISKKKVVGVDNNQQCLDLDLPVQVH